MNVWQHNALRAAPGTNLAAVAGRLISRLGPPGYLGVAKYETVSSWKLVT
jgi:hypothetical protein